jgi:dTDP-glucose 4,6-dehydratase
VDRSIDDAAVFIQTNVLGTFNVLEASRITKIKTVIHVSTDEVYGSLAEGSADETYSLLPNSPYAASKAASDLLARSYFVTHGLDVRTTRCCNNYGKYQYPEKVIPVIINSIQTGKKIPIYGNGANIREWISVLDHCKAILAVIAHGENGEVYNIGSGNSISNLELAELICNLENYDLTNISFVTDRKGHDFRYSLNSNKLRIFHKTEPNSFMSDLKETIVWYKKNTNYWN